MDITALLAQLLSLAGVGALVAVIVNVLKWFGLVQDDTAPTWVAGINLVLLVALFLVKVFLPAQDIGQLDSVAATVAQLLTFVFALVVQIWGSKLTHAAVRGVPLLGFSYSLKLAKAAK